MKKHLIQLGVALLVLFLLNPLAAQNRSSQIELFGGVAFPLAPDFFKDYNKLGGSIHGQYVIFPSPNMGISIGAAIEGFSFDGDKYWKILQQPTPLLTIAAWKPISAPELSKSALAFGLT